MNMLPILLFVAVIAVAAYFVGNNHGEKKATKTIYDNPDLVNLSDLDDTDKRWVKDTINHVRN